MSCSCKNNQNNHNNQINRLSNRLRLLVLNRPNLFSGTIILNGVVNKIRTSLTLSLNDDKTVSYIHQILGKNNQFIKPFEGDKGIINNKGFLAVNNDGITQKYNSSDQTLEITSVKDNSIVGFLSWTPNTNPDAVPEDVVSYPTYYGNRTVKFPSPAPNLNNPQFGSCIFTNNGICIQGSVYKEDQRRVTTFDCIKFSTNSSFSIYGSFFPPGLTGAGWNGVFQSKRTEKFSNNGNPC